MKANNKLGDLRGHLFDVIERLKDPKPEAPMDTKTAEAICLAAKRLVETAHVELEFRQQFGRELEASEFLEQPKKRRRLEAV
jgi:hypothetical protein